MNRRSLFRSALAVVFGAPVAAAAVKLPAARAVPAPADVKWDAWIMQNGSRIDFMDLEAGEREMALARGRGWKFMVFDGERHYSEVKAHPSHITPQFGRRLLW